MIITESGTSIEGKPFCILRWEDENGEEKGAAQMSPDELRAFASRCLETAEAAETDAMMLLYMTKKIGISKEQFGGMLATLREFRSKARAKAGDE